MSDNEAQNKSITVYSADWCGYCQAIKKYFADKKIEYTEKNVEQNPEYAQEAVEKSGQMGIPVVDIDGKIIVGFDRMKINDALGISNF